MHLTDAFIQSNWQDIYFSNFAFPGNCPHDLAVANHATMFEFQKNSLLQNHVQNFPEQYITGIQLMCQKGHI